MADKQQQITGLQRAAIFLMSLGEQEAAVILKHLGAKEVQKLGLAMTTVNSVTRDQLDDVMDDFVENLDSQTSVGIGSDDYVRNVLMQALGEEKAGGLVDSILHGRNSRGLETLKWMDAKAVAGIIRNEHPQIIAIVLSYLDNDHAAEVMRLLPERTRPDVLMRIATIGGIQPTALNELNEVLERQFSGGQGLKSSALGGIKVAANILNMMESTLETQILKDVTEADNELSQRIQDLMFVFDDLAELEDRAIQAILRDIPGDKLGLALRGADTAVREKITKNMSKRAGQMLLEDMETRGPVKVSEVEGAQKEILGVMRKLVESGVIQTGAKGDDLI